MFSVALVPHPSAPCRSVRTLQVRVSRNCQTLRLHYAIKGDISGLLIPDPSVSRRSEGLWRQTCFEAFLSRPGRAGYFELNFAPSMAWAAYRFDAYRQGMSPVTHVVPELSLGRAADRLDLTAAVNLDDLSPVLASVRLRLALSAVTEEPHAISYWALAHPPGQPDFHHPDGFAMELDPFGGCFVFATGRSR